MSKKKKTSPGVIAVNKKARHEYELMDNVEAGLALMGSEVKSLRLGKVAFADAYVKFRSGEAWLVGLNIAPYEHAGYSGHEPTRDRKLLLHGREITLLASKVEQKGLSLIPIKIYLKRGRIKVEIALARGKKLHDRREDLKRKAVEQDLRRQMSRG